MRLVLMKDGCVALSPTNAAPVKGYVEDQFPLGGKPC